jgi:hypothetical protein
MTGSGKRFAVLAALGALLLYCAHDAYSARAAELEVQAAEALQPQDLAYAILKTLMVRKISALGGEVWVTLQDSFGFFQSAPCQGLPSREMAVNR